MYFTHLDHRVFSGRSGGSSLGEGMVEAVGVCAGFDDGAVEGEPVDDRGAEPRVGKGFGPAGEGFVGGDCDRVLFFAFGEDLEEQLDAASVSHHSADSLASLRMCRRRIPHRAPMSFDWADVRSRPSRIVYDASPPVAVCAGLRDGFTWW